MPGRPPSELASLSLLLQFRVLQDWEVGAVIGRGQTVQQGVSHPLLGARAGLTPPPQRGSLGRALKVHICRAPSGLGHPQHDREPWGRGEGASMGVRPRGTLRADRGLLEAESRCHWLGRKSNCIHSGATACSLEATVPGLRDRDAVAEAEVPLPSGLSFGVQGQGQAKGPKEWRPKGQDVMRNPSVERGAPLGGWSEKGRPQPCSDPGGRKCKGPEAGARWVSLGPAWWPVCAKRRAGGWGRCGQRVRQGQVCVSQPLTETWLVTELPPSVGPWPCWPQNGQLKGGGAVPGPPEAQSLGDRESKEAAGLRWSVGRQNRAQGVGR